MAGILDRVTRALRQKSGAGEAAPADPRAAFEGACEQQAAVLQEVRRGVAGVAAARKRLEQQTGQMAAEIDRLTQAARRAVEQGNEGLAREALERRAALGAQLDDLDTRHRQLQLEEEKLVLTSTRLQAKLDRFRAQQAAVVASSSADEALASVSAALDGLGPDLGDADRSVRASAQQVQQVSELLASEGHAGRLDASPELDEQVAHDLAAMRADPAGVPGASDEQGSYRQPGAGGTIADVQDAQHAETTDTEERGQGW